MIKMSELVKSPIVLYYQIAKILLQEFLNSYESGSKVPTEPELIARFNVSRTTIRQAMALLEENGVLVRKSGKGTFLTTSPKLQVELSELTGFVEDMVLLGLEPSTNLISINTISPGLPVTEKLDLPEDAKVVFIERVRLAEDEPISFDATYLAECLGSKVAQDDLVVQPIFYLLENKYGVELSVADYSIEASIVPKRIAKYLQIPNGSPIILIERTSYSVEGSPVDYEKLYCRADKIRYHMRLTRKKPSLV